MKRTSKHSVVLALTLALLALGVSASASSAAPVDFVSAADGYNGYTCILRSGDATCRGNAPAHAPYLHEFNPINGLTGTVTDFSAGVAHSCAVVGGAAECWGSNGSGRLGVGPYLDKDTPTQVVGLTSGVTKVDVRGDLSCAIVSGGAKCWGGGSNGKLGDGTGISNTGLPTDVSGLSSEVTDISAGFNHACAVVSGAAKCWGGNLSGQLGIGSQTGTNAPAQVAGLTAGVTSIAAGNAFSCAVVSGAVKCWGDNGSGQLGDGSNTPSATPVQVTGITSGATAVSVGAFHACAIVSGIVKCWGQGDALGHNLLTPSKTPVAVVGVPSGATQIDAASDHSCAIASGSLYCWGDPFALGFGVTPTSFRPYATHVEFTDDTGCYIHAGELGCWGEDDGYSGENADSPGVPTGLESGVTDSAVGGGHLCAIKNSAAYCWGENYYGQMGIGTETSAKSEGSPWPVEVPGLDSDVSDIAAGALFTCAVVDASAACFGDNYYGELGIGDTDATDGYAYQVDGIASGATAVTAGTYFACAIVSGGAKCWGRNEHGQLGNGSTTESPSPVQVSGLTSGVSYIEAEGESACAVQSGAVKCWGTNTDGMLGDGSTTERHAPVTVSGITSGASLVSVGYRHSCAVVSGAIKCWGNNGFGQLGDGRTKTSLTPVEVYGSNPGGSDVSAGFDQTCGVFNGATRCWGKNRGQMYFSGYLKPLAQRSAFEPITTFESKPPTLTTSGTANFTLSSDDPDATFQCELDRSGDVGEYSGTVELTGLSSNEHSLDCRAVNANGYSDPVGVQYTWYVDQIPPNLLAESEGVAYGQWKITFGTWPEYELATSTCALDGAAAAPCTSGFVTPVLAVGSHSLTLAVGDQAGNISTRVFTFVVPSLAKPPGGGGGTTKVTPSIDVAPRSVKVGKSMKLSVTCPDGCTLSAFVKIGSKKVKLPPVTVGPGQASVTVKIPSSVAKKIRAGLKGKKKVVVTFTPSGGSAKSVTIKNR